jgi:hypothetical protein
MDEHSERMLHSPSAEGQAEPTAFPPRSAEGGRVAWRGVPFAARREAGQDKNEESVPAVPTAGLRAQGAAPCRELSGQGSSPRSAKGLS